MHGITLMDNSSVSYNDSYQIHYGGEEETRIETIIIPVIFTIIVVLGCLGNFLVILVVIRNREHYKNTTNLFILNLSVADLFFVLFCVPFHIFTYTGPWPFGDFVCRLIHIGQYCSMVTSIGTLVAMSLDRFLAVCFPLETKHLRTPRSALVICVIVWMFAFFSSSPMGIVYTVRVYNHPVHGDYPVCADDWGHYDHFKSYYYLALFIATYVLPTLLIAIFSILTVLQLWAMEATDGPSERLSYIAKRRVTRLIFVVVAVFALCWLPSHIMWLWFGFFPETVKYEYGYYYYALHLVAHILSYANSCLNPIIYAFLSSGFRRGFKKALRCRRAGSRFGANGREEVIEFRRRGTPSRSTYKGRFSTALSTLNRPQTHVMEEML